MIVIDVGCGRFGNDYSVERLLEDFHPDHLYGFDPQWTDDMLERKPFDPSGPTGPTRAMHILCQRMAAWVYDGWIGFKFDDAPLISRIQGSEVRVPCIDLARFIRELPEDEIVLKLDAEGAEYELLEHLLETGEIKRVSRLLIEWHHRDEGKRRHAIEMALREHCQVEQWRW